MRCFVQDCNNTSASRNGGLSFHSFPKKHFREWLELMGNKENVNFSVNLKVCSKHFTPDCFDRTGQTVRLKDGSKPSLHLGVMEPTMTIKNEYIMEDETIVKREIILDLETPQQVEASTSLPSSTSGTNLQFEEVLFEPELMFHVNSDSSRHLARTTLKPSFEEEEVIVKEEFVLPESPQQLSASNSDSSLISETTATLIVPMNEEVDDPEPESEETRAQRRALIHAIHSYSLNTPKLLEKRSKNLIQCRRELATARQKIRRLEEKIMKLTKEIHKLKTKNLLTNSAFEHIQHLLTVQEQ